MKRVTSISMIVAVSLLLPTLASACAVCMTGKEDDTRIAFGLMTAFMTVMPFLVCGGVLWWLRGRLKEIEAMHERVQEGVQRGEPQRSAPTLSPVEPTGN